MGIGEDIKQSLDLKTLAHNLKHNASDLTVEQIADMLNRYATQRVNDVTWGDLKDELKEVLRDVNCNVQRLLEFESKANPNLFIHMYGEYIGQHLWNKFRETRCITHFIKELDIDNKTIFMTKIFAHNARHGANPLYAYC